MGKKNDKKKIYSVISIYEKRVTEPSFHMIAHERRVAGITEA